MPFRVALAQVDPTVGDLAGNRELMCKYIEMAKALGADLVAFPEMCLTGYPPEDLLLRPHFVADSKAALRRLASCADGITVVAGCVYNRGGQVHNAAAVLHRKRIVGVYCKQLLPNYGVFDEKRYFAPGEENIVWHLGEAGIGVSICEDIWLNDGPHLAQVGAGAGVIVNISSSPYHAGKHPGRQKMLRARARATGAYVCYANLVGGQDELIFDGGSMIISPTGKMIAMGTQFEEDLVVADLDLSAVRGPRKSAPPGGGPVAARKLQPYKRQNDRPQVACRVAPGLARWEEVYCALVLGLRDYVVKNRFEKVTIGLSGGIDSALTAAVAVDALGSENVIGVTMPSRYTSNATLSDSGRTARNFGIRLITLPIENAFRAYLDDLADVFDGLAPDTTEENIQARIRGNLLMALSNKFGWLVITTGNKSETSTGYCTLYGDMAGGFSILKDVPKTWVYKLAEHRNRQAGADYIPQSIIDRAPSAELRPDQKDEDSLPPYDVLDQILDAYIEKDKSRAQIEKMGFDPGLVARVAGLVDRNEYKRRQAPPGLKITPKAFGRDRRMPIVNRYT
ncbi:MAG: NAD+ synthase [Planctomycetes bacterium]|nr:NAD+ synthase [Planctomycetota bacterium]